MTISVGKSLRPHPQHQMIAKMDTGVRFWGCLACAIEQCLAWVPSHKGQPQFTHLTRGWPHPTLGHFIPQAREAHKTRDLVQKHEAGGHKPSGVSG